jgi:hypothetical protein
MYRNVQALSKTFKLCIPGHDLVQSFENLPAIGSRPRRRNDWARQRSKTRRLARVQRYRVLPSAGFGVQFAAERQHRAFDHQHAHALDVAMLTGTAMDRRKKNVRLNSKGHALLNTISKFLDRINKAA